MQMSAVLSIRVPKDIKERLNRFKGFDWKSFIINAIEIKLRELETEEIFKKIDEMNKKLLDKPSPPSWKLIKEDREV